MIPHSRPLPTSLLGPYHTGTCHELGHTWHPSCIRCFLELVYYVFVGAVKVYGPLYLISDIARQTPIKDVLLKTMPHVLRSSVFLTTNGSGFIGCLCLLRHLIGRFYYPLAAYAPAFISAFVAILIERKSRRGLLAGYISTLAVDALYQMLKYRGLITPIPYGEVMLFCAASAVLLPAYRSREGLHDAIGSVLSVLFHPRYPKGVTRFVESILQGPVTTWRYAGYVCAKIALLSLWCYAIGYITQVAVGLVSSGSKILRKWKRLKHVLLNWYNVKFGVFLAAHIGGFKVLEAILFLLPVSRNVRMTIAGMLAGLAMTTIHSSSLSLYAATKALEVVYFKAVKKGWAKRFYYGDALLYAMTTAFVFHVAFFEAHNLRHSYWHFLSNVTGGRIGELNWEEIDRFGTEASKLFRRSETQSSSETNEEDS